MYHISLLTISVTAYLLAGINQLNAAELEHEHHEAHIHGEALLLVAVEEEAIEIEFNSPAMNIVGFEHLPVNEAQMQAVESAIAVLKQPDRVFSIPTVAKCEPVSVEVESPLVEHGDYDHEEETHSNFTGHYRFRCADISRLERIEVKLFKQFPGTEIIEVLSISERGQQKMDLTPGKATLEL